jgi:hypothetical protein
MRSVFRRTLQFAAIVLTLWFVPYLVFQTLAFDADPDIWWHIRVGDWIAQHHALPRVAIFSQHSDQPWTAYSWCFELLVSRVFKLYGLPGIPGLLVCLEVLISLTLLIAIWRIAGKFWWAWWIATAGIFAAYVNPLRPALLTLLFFILELFVIFEAERTGEDNTLYWLAPVFIAWANCHIQFVYGIAVLGLYIGCRILSLWLRKPAATESASSSSALKLAGFFLVGIVATCIGPNGWLPYKVSVGLASGTYVYQIVQEMLGMSFRRPEHYVELLLVMLACFSVGRSNRLREFDFFRPALLVLTAFVSFRSSRDAWFAAVAACFLIAEQVRERSTAAAAEDQHTKHAKWDAPIVAGATVAALALAFGYGANHGLKTADMVRQIDTIFPIRATEFIRDAHLQGPLYNDFNWGGFLIFNLPGQDVSIDPRTNVYGDVQLARAMATTSAMKWQSDPDLARANLVVLERYLPLAVELTRDPEYTLVYQDQVALVFVKKAPAQ